jgi:hypothetical protein
MAKIKKTNPLLHRRLGKLATEKVEKKPDAKVEQTGVEKIEGAEAEAMQPSKAAQAVLGQVAKSTGKRKKSAATRAALAGIEAQKKRPLAKWKKAVLAVVMGITMLNAVAPAMAQAADLANVPPPPAQEQVLDGNQLANGNDWNPQTFNPLSLRYQNPDDMGYDDLLNHTSDKLNNDGTVELGASSELTVDDVSQQAYKNFQIRVDQALDRDAVSLANGESPVMPGDSLTQGQQNRLMDALSDLISDMPLGSLSEKVSGPIISFLDANGVDTENIETMRLDDLGKPGGDALQNLLEDWRDDNPASFWTVAGAAGTAVATYGYLQGSDALEDIGIKPEVSASLFGEAGIEVEGEWGPKFQDGSVSVLGTYDLGDHELGAGARYMDGEFSPKLSWEYRGDSVRTDLDLTLGDDVELDAKVHYRPNQALSGVAQVRLGDIDGGDDFATLGARYRLDDKTVLGFDAGANFDADTYRTNLSYDYQPTEDLHLHVRGGYNEAQGANVGVGVTFNF